MQSDNNKEKNNPVRADKFLWAMRLFKTRGLATDACRMGRVLIGNSEIKPSHDIKEGDRLIVRKPPVSFTFRVKQVAKNRLPARLVPEYLEDLTPEEERQKAEIQRHMPGAYRKKGSGRPTKKERRLIDRLNEGPD